MLLATITSCKKEDNTTVYTIKAHLYRGKFKTPYRKENVAVYMHYTQDGALRQEKLGAAQTNYFGYMEFTYPHFKKGKYIKLYVDRSKNFRDDKYILNANQDISIELYGE